MGRRPRLHRRVALHVLCFCVVLATRIGLSVTSYQRVRRLLVRASPQDPQPHRIGVVAQTARIVVRVARFVPGASCLTQTIACQAVLSWRGIPSTIAMGVKKTEAGTVLWHAWLVWNEKVALQGNETSLEGFGKLIDLPTPESARLPS